MRSIPEIMAMAVKYHLEGRFSTAEQLYRDVLYRNPNHADALHHVGIIANQMGKYDVAVDFISRAIQQYGNSADFHYNLGGAFFHLGRLKEAVASFRQTISLNPEFAMAHNNLGCALKDLGELDEAQACYLRALKLQPECAVIHNNLGSVLKDLGRLEDAIGSCRRALELDPNLAEAHRDLGSAYFDQQEFDEAIHCYRKALALRPDLADVHKNLGHALRQKNSLDEAIACFRQAVALNPRDCEAHKSLGHALRSQGAFDEAIECYCNALTLVPKDAHTISNMGVALAAKGKIDVAMNCYTQALALDPSIAETHNNMGNLFRDQGRQEEAITCFRKALECNPKLGEVHINLCMALVWQGKLVEAVECCRQAIALRPNSPEAYNNMGVALMCQCQLDEAIDCFRKALALRPDYVMARSNMLFTHQYRDGETLASLAKAHAEFDQEHAIGVRETRVEHATVREDRPLRLGFVSADFGCHPVGYFLIRVLENLANEQVETVIYSDRLIKDELTRRFYAAATHWRDTKFLDDSQLAEQIRADRIDILFDLAGHTAQNRIMVFARKPAPVQITWIGYEGTTGLSAMDYLLADRFVVPKESEIHYREKVLRMPDGYLCFEPPASAPPVGPLPSSTNNYFTFGSFNNLAKITPRVLDTWATILRQSPNSRLVMKARGLGDPKLNEWYRDAFASRGVDLSRIQILPPSSRTEYLADYQLVDLLLDPFPFAGGTTTCDAFWMGVPVLTCPGETFASRHTLSHFFNVGMSETIAENLDDYVRLAVDFASDPARVERMRMGLRERMAASPLCDGKRFATNLMTLLRDVWERSQNGREHTGHPHFVSRYTAQSVSQAAIEH